MNLTIPHLHVSGNYYGTPRPVHISAESPPITYQEHRNLLRNFRKRSRSLSNLEKTAEEENSEEDSGLSGMFNPTCSMHHFNSSTKCCIVPLSIALVSNTQMDQSLAQLVCSKLSEGLWPHRSLDHLQRKVRMP